MKLTTHTILALWRDRPDWATSYPELVAALDVRRTQERRLQTLLDELVAKGALEAERRRYRLGTPRAAGGVAAPGARRVPVSAVRGEQPGLLGVFSAHPNGFGFVELTGEREAVFVPPKAIGGALDGDRVRVQRRVPRPGERGSGHIVEVLERRHARVRGHVQLDYGQCWVAPLSEKLPMIFIAEGADPAPWPDGALVEVEITAFPEHPDEAPDGRVVRIFEDDGDAPEQVVLHILSDLALSPEFSPATHTEMARLPEVPALELAGREDQRALPFVTIDGDDARDFDDAVCLQALPGGRRRLWVAIADVAAFVAPGAAVDGDAYRKGTSVYFPNQVFPMLPERLSNDLCSLRPREPRLTVTCQMDFDRDGRRVDYRVFDGVIESRARLTYKQVQALFETGADKSLPGELTAMLADLRKLATQLRELREARGALDFSFPEYRFELDDRGWPVRVLESYATEATRLIEQCMLEANETVAEHCATEKLPILYRVHDPPPPDQIKNLAVTLLNFGVEVKADQLGRPGGMKALLGRIVGHPQREAVEIAILRSLSQAQYRASNDGHYALAAPYYAHFTSPIRRYPDLLLHRALKASFGQRRRPFALASDAGLHTSVCERTAGAAEGRVIRLYKVLYMEGRLGETFAATVGGVSERGLWLRLRDEPVDGLLPMMSLPMAPPKYDRERSQLITRGQRRNIGLGDTLRVTLARADRLSQQIEFAFLGWGWEEGAQPSKPHPEGPGAPQSRAEMSVEASRDLQPKVSGRQRPPQAGGQATSPAQPKPKGGGAQTRGAEAKGRGSKAEGSSAPKAKGRAAKGPSTKGRAAKDPSAQGGPAKGRRG